jgi:purine-nucleoside phosphorylase
MHSPIGVVLGSGLGAFADTLDDPRETPYSEIPDWPHSTAVGHAGKLITGRIETSGGETTDVIVLAGRAHLYEGYTAHQVTFGIRELHRRGVRGVILTNAAGGINLDYLPGDLVLISDHINLLGQNPLTGPNDDSLGPRFPDMSQAYSREYREVAQQAAAELALHSSKMLKSPEALDPPEAVKLHEGIYAAVPGPSYETPAEIRYLRSIGADLVGMSTVPETIVANHLGMKVLAISCVTNMAAGILPQTLRHSEVIETGERVKDTLIQLLRAVIPGLR